jgi:hypothetical protein
MATDTQAKSTYTQYREDISKMLEYCGDYGIRIPEAIGKEISKLPDPPPETPPPTPDQLTDVISVHGKLSALIAPATPRSLDATEFPPRSTRAWLTYGLIGFLILAAAVGVAGYIKTLPVAQPPAKSPDTQPGKPPEKPADAPKAIGHHGFVVAGLRSSVLAQAGVGVVPSVTAELNRTQWNYFYAAALGAAFNGLFTAYKYLLNRSFDHGYVVVYVIRFVLGLVAGMILGNLGAGLFAGDTTLSKLGPGMISLLGGYSAEAVRQILDRLVEVLVSVVRGKGDTAAAERVNVAKDVLEVSEAAAKANSADEVRSKLNALLRKLRQ